MREILVTGLIPCGGAGRLSWVGEYRLSHGLVKIFRNAYGQLIGARSITYNDEKSKPSSITGKSGLHPLIHTFTTRSSAQDVEKKKNGAKDSAFS
jgi:hypothetical protein